VSDEDITRNYHGGNPRSEEAHESTRRRKLRDQLRILQLLFKFPEGLTCDEAEIMLNMSHQTCSARFSDMKKKGWILPTGGQRLTRSKSNADVFYSKPGIGEVMKP
jgi:Fic family protein